MKCYRRYCSVFLCLVLLFSICSVPVSAEVIDNKPYYIYVDGEVQTYYESPDFGPYLFYPNNGTQEVRDFEVTAYFANKEEALIFNTTYYVANNDKSSLAVAGNPVTIKLEGCYDGFVIYHPTNDQYKEFKYGDLTEFRPTAVTIYYTDGSIGYADATTTVRSDKSLDFSTSFTPEKDVQKIGIYVRRSIGYSSISAYGKLDGTRYKTVVARMFGEPYGDSYFALTIDQATKEEGLLGGILDKVTGGFSALGDKLSNVFSAITDLPAKIWEFIENGLKSLFVPDEDYMTSYKDRWEELLGDRLGAVYQVVQITFGAWEDIETADQINTIAMPSVSIPLPDDNEFTFGGYDVKIVPDGLEGLVTALKTIVGIVCTIMFINGLRKRYDEIMGVEQ